MKKALITLILASLSLSAIASQEYKIIFQTNSLKDMLPEEQTIYKSCDEIAQNGQGEGDGTYTINPTGNNELDVYCDMTTDGNGWTLVMNNIGNKSDLDMLKNVGDISNINSHGNIKLSYFMDGETILKWEDANNNTLLKAQENGNTFEYTYLTDRSYTSSCPSTNHKYNWIKLYANDSWSNNHYPGLDHADNPCTNWLDYGNDVYNYVANLDCVACNHPESVIFGNGASDYYDHGNVYDNDYLKWNGQAQFGDIKPDFWSNNSTHRLWIK